VSFFRLVDIGIANEEDSKTCSASAWMWTCSPGLELAEYRTLAEKVLAAYPNLKLPGGTLRGVQKRPRTPVVGMPAQSRAIPG